MSGFSRKDSNESQLGLGLAQQGQITRQVSKSLITPSNLNKYMDIFKDSNRNTGYVMLRVPRTDNWEKKWFVYDNGVLEISDGPLSNCLTRDGVKDKIKKIPMQDVVTFSSEKKAKIPTICVKTVNETIQARVENLDELNKWIFCFQKTSASLIIHILNERNQQSLASNSLLSNNLNSNLTRESSYGHSDLSNASRRHSHKSADLLAAASAAIAIQHEEESSIQGPGPLSPARLARNISDQNQTNFNTSTSSTLLSKSLGDLEYRNKLLSISPAIPINIAYSSSDNEDDSGPNTYRDRIASSFHENSSDLSPLEGMMRRREEEEEFYEDDDFIEVPSRENSMDDDDSMMFDMDDHLSDSAPQVQNKEIHNKDHTSSNVSSSSISVNSITSSLSSLALKEEKKILKWRAGTCSKFGPRDKNEDKFVCIPNIYERTKSEEILSKSIGSSNFLSTSISNTTIIQPNLVASSTSSSTSSHNFTTCTSVEKTIGYFSIFDGHGGDHAAIYCQNYLLNHIIERERFYDNIIENIRQSCLDIDKKFLELCDEKNYYSGTTVLGCFLLPKKLVIFYIGDSTAVLCTNNGEAVLLTDPHKPNRADESERVTKAGGWITEESELYLARLKQMDLSDPFAYDKAKNLDWVTIYRVCGELAVSRSIGDPDYKRINKGEVVKSFFSWPDNHNKIFYDELVISEPDFYVQDITPSDEFFILASDGVWDVMSPEEAVRFVRDSLKNGKTPHEVSEALVDLSIRLGSSDNVTVIIVQLQHS